MRLSLSTQRLALEPLITSDLTFIHELANSPEWLEFISDGSGKSLEKALEYIDNILANPTCIYWVVRLSDDTPIGIITYMKRIYLPHQDIGFAFLARYKKKGYAFEAANAILQALASSGDHKRILATTIPANTSSIRLLEKLGFEFETEILRDEVKLLLYSVLMKSFLF